MTTSRPSERRLVHVLFVDLVGFTGLVEELDAEDVALLQEHYFSQVAGLVAAAGGQVEKYIGDAVLATFGLPVLGPDDAVAAVRAGLAVIDSLARVEADLALVPGTLQVRVGVHTGEVVVTWAADGSWRLSGDVVNTAARLQSVAAPGSVVVGPDTALAVGDAVSVEPLGEVALKGKAERLAAYRVAPRPTRARDAGMRSTFHGRADDLARLQAAHRDARGAERLTVLAPPGVGRTRLVEEFRARTDAPVWLARVRRDEPGYAPVAALLTEAGVTSATIAERLAHHGHVGPRAELSARHTTALLTGAALDGTPEELWTSWTAVLDAHDDPGGPTPVWVLDDVHLAGADLLAFLAHATAAPHRAARLVVTTARPGEHSPDGAVLPLDPLTDDDVTSLVADRAALPPEVVDRIRCAAGGNPLYVVELLRAWELAASATPTVPSTIRAIYLAQLDALPPPSRALLGQGSVAGRILPASALPDLGVAEPDRPLRELTGAGLLTGPHPDVVDPASYTYRHLILRDTAYATLPRARRAALHLRFASWLERRGARVELVARHLTSAFDEAPALAGPIDGRIARNELGHRAASALTDAGDALIGSEPHRAAELFARAHDLTDPAPSELRAHRRLRTAEALRRAGRLTEAMTAFAAVAEAAAPGTHAARAAAALGYEDALFDSRLPRAIWGGRALDLLADALALTPPAEAGLRSRLLAATARAHAYGGDVATARGVGDEAIALARGAHDPGALAYALLARRPTLAEPAALGARLADDAELVAATRAAGDPDRQFEALRLSMVDRLETGSTTAAEALADEATGLAVRPLHLWYPAMWRAMMLLHHGSPDEAADAVEHFRREGERWHYGDTGQVHSVQLLAQHTLLGTPELALPTLVRVAREVGGRTWLHVAAGYARAGRSDEAAALLTRYAADGFAAVGHDGARAFLLAEAAEVADAVGDARAGAELYDLLAPWDGLAVVVGSGALCLGAAEHFRGLAARAAGRDPAEHLRRALAVNEASGAIHAAARSRTELRQEGRSRC